MNEFIFLITNLLLLLFYFSFMNEFIFRNTTGNSLLVHCIFSCMNEFNFLSTN